MFDWLLWFTEPGNSKVTVLILLLGTFCAILIYVFTGKKRSARLESYKYIPFQNDEPVDDESQSEKVAKKVMNNERNR